MKPIQVLILILFSPLGLYAQTLGPTVVASGGGYNTAGGYSLSHTQGELVIVTATSSGKILTQGFQQTYISGAVISTIDKTENISIKLYPNPTTDIGIIEIESTKWKDFVLDVLDMKGAVLQSSFFINISNGPVKIDLADKAPGYYFIRIRVKEGSYSRTLKIQKTNI